MRFRSSVSSVNGDLVQTTLFGAVRVLYRDGMWPIAGLVFVTTFLMPLLQMSSDGVSAVAAVASTPARTAPDIVFRVLHLARPWGMTEVLILGMLVALVKLAHIASVVPGVALWAFGALMLLLAAASAAFDPHELWERIGGRYQRRARPGRARRDTGRRHGNGAAG